MSETIIGAGAEVAVLAGEARVASTNPIVAMHVVSAASLTSLQRAVSAHEAVIAHAGPVNTLSVAVALVRAG